MSQHLTMSEEVFGSAVYVPGTLWVGGQTGVPSVCRLRTTQAEPSRALRWEFSGMIGSIAKTTKYRLLRGQVTVTQNEGSSHCHSE